MENFHSLVAQLCSQVIAQVCRNHDDRHVGFERATFLYKIDALKLGHALVSDAERKALFGQEFEGIEWIPH